MGTSAHGSPTSPRLIVEQVALGPLQANCFILHIAPRPEAVVIDPGAEPERLLAVLGSLSLTAAAAVLTHGHFDHIGAAPALAARGVPVLIHAADAAALSNPEHSGAALFGFDQENCQTSRLLADSDSIDIWGGEAVLRVMHTPGHSPGSICLISDGVIFAGDLVFAGSIGRTDLPGGDDAAMQASLTRLLTLPDGLTIYPGHGPATTLADERLTNPFL